MRQGDVVTRIGGVVLGADPGGVERFVEKVKVNPKRALPLEVVRGVKGGEGKSPDFSDLASGERLSLTISPAEMPDGTGRIGMC